MTVRTLLNVSIAPSVSASLAGARGRNDDLGLEVRLGFQRVRNQAVFFGLFEDDAGFLAIGLVRDRQGSLHVEADELRQLLHLVERALSLDGYEVVTASDGAQALEAVTAAVSSKRPFAVEFDGEVTEAVSVEASVLPRRLEVCA